MLYRTVSTSFWTDSKVIDDFTPEDRYFYLYLFTNPHTNLCGCYEVSARQIAYELGYSKEAVENLLKRFQEVHKVIKYSQETKELLLLNWHKYNWTKSPRFQVALEKEIETVKDNGFREYLVEILYGIDTVSTIDGYRIDTSNTNTNTNTNTSSSSNSNSSSSSNSNSSSNSSSKKEPRHKYGEYNNVLLSDKDLEKLKAEFPSDWQERIERLSGYIKSKGTAYKDHLATIRNWARREKPKSRTDIVDSWV